MTDNKNRGWQRVLLLIFPYIIIVGVFQLIGVICAGVDINNPNPDYTTLQHTIISVFNVLGTCLLLWLFMEFADKEKFINLGFQIKNRGKDIIIGIILGLVIISLGYFSLLFLKEINYTKITFNFKEVLLSILLFTLVSAGEEMLFRGYILKNLMISFHKYTALLVTSLLFALMHGFNPNIDLFSLLNLFLGGIVLGITYIHTKNLWFPMALHLSWNLFQTFYGFNVSGQKSYSIIEFTIQNPNKLNGGEFGFEGTILAVIAQIITISIIAFYYYRKSNNNSSGKTQLVQTVNKK